MILSHVFTIDQVTLRRLKSCGVRIYVNEVQGEIEGNEIGIAGTYPENIDYNLFDGIFVWSTWSRRWLIEKYALDKDRVHAIGCTRMSLIKYVDTSKINKMVGFICRFEMLNPFDGRHPFYNLMEINPFGARGQGYLDRSNVDARLFAFSVQVIKKLVQKGARVLVRPHPNEDLRPYGMLKAKLGPDVEIDEGADFSGFLDRVSVVLGPLSSAFTEPYLLKIPVISLSGVAGSSYEIPHQQPFIKLFSRASRHVETIDEIVEQCLDDNLDPASDPELNEMLSAVYSLPLNNDPASDLVDIVDEDNSQHISRTRSISEFAGFIKVSLDAVYWLYCVTKKDKGLARRILRQYNYNSLVHRPTDFMKNIKCRISAE